MLNWPQTKKRYMKKENGLATGTSEPESVDAFMQTLNYPLSDLVRYLRTFIMNIDPHIGEGIYWNAPAFFYTGKMEPFDPKKYKRYIVGLNFYRQDTLRLVFLRGVLANDHSGLLEGDYKDGRRIASFKSLEEFKSSEKTLSKIIKQLIKRIDE